jgi:hypothetical protein
MTIRRAGDRYLACPFILDTHPVTLLPLIHVAHPPVIVAGVTPWQCACSRHPRTLDACATTLGSCLSPLRPHSSHLPWLLMLITCSQGTPRPLHTCARVPQPVVVAMPVNGEYIPRFRLMFYGTGPARGTQQHFAVTHNPAPLLELLMFETLVVWRVCLRLPWNDTRADIAITVLALCHNSYLSLLLSGISACHNVCSINNYGSRGHRDGSLDNRCSVRSTSSS